MDYSTFDPSIVSTILVAYFAILLPILLVVLIGMWRVYSKAGQPGWAVLIPFYNLYVFTQIIRRPGWWMLLYFASLIPVVGSIAVLVVSIMDYLRLAKVYGKSVGFGVGLVLLSPVFIPILGFGSASYDAARLDEQ